MNLPQGPVNPNIPSRSVNPEQVTDLRYSLANELIGSQDYLMNHPAGNPRVIIYPRSETLNINEIREKLIDHNLILGYTISQEDESEQAFIIPRSARPLAHEAKSNVAGNYSYNDSKLIYDLGHMLGTLFTIDAQKYVLKNGIGNSVAIVEFTKPDERRLFFVPGIERIIEPSSQTGGPLEKYIGELSSEFGGRFDSALLFFRQGYMRAVAEGGSLHE